MRDRDCEPLRVSVDHKPNLGDEVTRVEANGGMVKNVNGIWRVVHPSCSTMLAVSRAFGDRELKLVPSGPLVSCMPYVATVSLSPREQFVILASDGLWDVVDDSQAMKIVGDICRKAAGGSMGTDMSSIGRSKLPQAAADALLKRAIELGSNDNITVLVAWLHWDV